MRYIDGFVLAVPAANKQVYIDHATKAVPLFREFGVTRMVENWGDDISPGKVTDFPGAVQATDEEVVLFSWIEWPDKAVRDAGMKRMMEDPRMAELGEMPFDGKRMIFGGFVPLVDDGDSSGFGYVDGFLVAVKADNKQAYKGMADQASVVFREHGALQVMEAWGDDVRPGKVTDFRRAVKAADDEIVVFSWVAWPSKAVRDSGGAKVMEDPRMQPDHDTMPFDGKRMIYGGFANILDA